MIEALVYSCTDDMRRNPHFPQQDPADGLAGATEAEASRDPRRQIPKRLRGGPSCKTIPQTTSGFIVCMQGVDRALPGIYRKIEGRYIPELRFWAL